MHEIFPLYRHACIHTYKKMLSTVIYHLTALVAAAELASVVAVADVAWPDDKQPSHTVVVAAHGDVRHSQVEPHRHNVVPTYNLKYHTSPQITSARYKN